MASLRVWQNTRVAALTTGVATLAPQTLGYEWDEDLDNGARPAGLVHLSSTTDANVEKIVDYGALVGAHETATHSLTLYRHTNGALVFGAVVHGERGLGILEEQPGVSVRGIGAEDAAVALDGLVEPGFVLVQDAEVHQGADMDGRVLEAALVE